MLGMVADQEAMKLVLVASEKVRSFISLMSAPAGPLAGEQSFDRLEET